MSFVLPARVLWLVFLRRLPWIAPPDTGFVILPARRSLFSLRSRPLPLSCPPCHSRLCILPSVPGPDPRCPHCLELVLSCPNEVYYVADVGVLGFRPTYLRMTGGEGRWLLV